MALPYVVENDLVWAALGRVGTVRETLLSVPATSFCFLRVAFVLLEPFLQTSSVSPRAPLLHVCICFERFPFSVIPPLRQPYFTSNKRILDIFFQYIFPESVAGLVFELFFAYDGTVFNDNS